MRLPDSRTPTGSRTQQTRRPKKIQTTMPVQRWRIAPRRATEASKVVRGRAGGRPSCER